MFRPPQIFVSIVFSVANCLFRQLNSSGTLVWSTTYGKTGQYSDQGIAVTVRDGYVYVGGSRYNKNLDMCTLKYRADN